MLANVALCRLEDIPDGGSMGLDPDEHGQDRLLAVRRGTQLWLYRNRCPHQGVAMAWRRNEFLDGARERIVCFAHGARFEIESGLCVLGPCEGSYLERVPFRVGADGSVQLDEQGGDRS